MIINRKSKKTSLTYAPLVSVALAVRNGMPYIREQLNSLLTQTYENFEIVISDDQSNDGTINVLNEYALKDKRLRWYSNPNPAGCSKNFELVFKFCKGKIIFPCDADDIWYPDRLEKHVLVYRDPTVMWVYNRSVLVDGYGKQIGYLEEYSPDYYIKKRTMRDNAWGSCIGGVHASYRASMIQKAFPLDPAAHAYDSWIQLAIWPAKSVFINEVLQAWRRHGLNESIWASEYDNGSEAFRARECEAIAANMRLIKSVMRNKKFALWKRWYFTCVYVGKRIRDTLRKTIH